MALRHVQRHQLYTTINWDGGVTLRGWGEGGHISACAASIAARVAASMPLSSNPPLDWEGGPDGAPPMSPDAKKSSMASFRFQFVASSAFRAAVWQQAKALSARRRTTCGLQAHIVRAGDASKVSQNLASVGHVTLSPGPPNGTAGSWREASCTPAAYGGTLQLGRRR